MPTNPRSAAKDPNRMVRVFSENDMRSVLSPATAGSVSTGIQHLFEMDKEPDCAYHPVFLSETNPVMLLVPWRQYVHQNAQKDTMVPGTLNYG